jgi:hypothetical protein
MQKLKILIRRPRWNEIIPPTIFFLLLFKSPLKYCCNLEKESALITQTFKLGLWLTVFKGTVA